MPKFGAYQFTNLNQNESKIGEILKKIMKNKISKFRVMQKSIIDWSSFLAAVVAKL